MSGRAYYQYETSPRKLKPQYEPTHTKKKKVTSTKKVKKQINPSLKINGILVTLAQMNTNLSKSTIYAIRENFGSNINVFDSVIPSAIKAGEAPIKGMSMFALDKDGKVAEAYGKLTNEVIKSHKPKSRDEYTR